MQQKGSIVTRCRPTCFTSAMHLLLASLSSMSLNMGSGLLVTQETILVTSVTSKALTTSSLWMSQRENAGLSALRMNFVVRLSFLKSTLWVARKVLYISRSLSEENLTIVLVLLYSHDALQGPSFNNSLFTRPSLCSDWGWMIIAYLLSVG